MPAGAFKLGLEDGRGREFLEMENRPAAGSGQCSARHSCNKPAMGLAGSGNLAFSSLQMPTTAQLPAGPRAEKRIQPEPSLSAPE